MKQHILSWEFAKTVSWQLFTLTVTLIAGRLYYGNWSLNKLMAILFTFFFGAFYVHERLWNWLRKRR